MVDDEGSTEVLGVSDGIFVTLNLIPEGRIDFHLIDFAIEVRVVLEFAIAFDAAISQLNHNSKASSITFTLQTAGDRETDLNDDGVLVVTLNDNAATDLNDGILLLHIVDAVEGTASVVVDILGSGLPT